MVIEDLKKVVTHARVDSKLYKWALAVKALKEVLASNPEEKDRVFSAIGAEFCNDIENTFSYPKNSLTKIFKMLYNSNSFAHMDTYFMALLSESFNPIVKEYEDEKAYGIQLGKMLTSLISISEKYGAEKAFEIAKEYVFGEKVIKSLEQTLHKYINGGIEDRFNSLMDEFEKYDIELNVQKFLERNGLNINLRLQKKACYLLSRRWEGISYVLGRFILKKIEGNLVEAQVLCNFWPLFLGDIWKAVLIHEAIHSILNSIVKREISSSTSHIGLQELYHSFINFLTIRETSEENTLKQYSNLILGLIPFGQLIGIAWYTSMEKKHPGFTQNILKTMIETRNRNVEIFVFSIENSLKQWTSKDIIEKTPNLFLFYPQYEFTKEIRKNPDNALLREAGAARCIFKILSYSSNPLSFEEIYKRIDDEALAKKVYRLFYYMPEKKYEKTEIERALNLLLKLEIIEIRRNGYALLL